MKWQTEVEIQPSEKRIDYSDSLLFVGSCFAAEMGARMSSLLFDVRVNPFGVLFNPASVASSLKRLIDRSLFTKDDLIKCDDLYKSFYHGSDFCALSQEEFLDINNRLLLDAANHFEKSRWIVITLGTSWVYRDKQSGIIVSNCHKIPASHFERFSMDISSIVSLIEPFIKGIPDKEWVFTVSPVRHLKDGAHGNQLSKSKLLLAVDEIVRNSHNAHYFPAYEVFIDQLRDYRYYASDMVHPSDAAVDYVWERFSEAYISNNCKERMKDARSLAEMKSHRILFPGSRESIRFIEKISILEKKLGIE